MTIIEKSNQVAICAICGDTKEGPGALIPIDGTEEGDSEGGSMQAIFVHIECLDLGCKKVQSSIMIYQVEQDRYDILGEKEG